MTLQSLLNKPNRPEPWHDKRFETTLATLRAMGFNSASTVLNFGGCSVFNDVLLEEVGCKVQNTCWDLREYKQATVQYDFALLMEVIEHLSDEPNPARVADWTYTGAENCLKTAAQHCNKLFLSTPNICGYKSIINLIEHRHPHTFAPHTHEYAPYEVAQLVERCGWKVEDMWTVDSWNNHGLHQSKVRLAQKLLQVAGAPKNLRQDNIFITATRK